MKKLLIFGGAGLLAVMLFVGSLVVVLKMRGGVQAGLARAPLVGGLLGNEAAAAEPPADAPAADASAASPPRQSTYLRFGTKGRIERLADDLKAKQGEWEASLRDLERRSRELDAWQRQMKQERDRLRQVLADAQEKLAREKEDMAKREEALATRLVAIEQAEHSNLKKTAEIYGKMEALRAAAILTTMYADGQQETVVKLLYLMTDRSAAKVLEAVVDPKVSAQITEKLQQVVRESAPGG